MATLLKDTQVSGHNIQYDDILSDDHYALTMHMVWKFSYVFGMLS